MTFSRDVQNYNLRLDIIVTFIRRRGKVGKDNSRRNKNGVDWQRLPRITIEKYEKSKINFPDTLIVS